jgi:3-hydroxyisobutyrate dehydrogenase-like beta-hydroxyacid dehydrogenase
VINSHLETPLLPNEPIQRIALIGFGEAGGILGHDLAARRLEVNAWDILFNSPAARDAMLAKSRAAKICAAKNLADAVTNADLIISAVTAASALEVAEAYVECGGLPPLSAVPASRDVLRAESRDPRSPIYLDINSVSPATKQKMSQLFEKSPARFVEAAVMAAFPPQRLKAPMLLGGPHAAAAAPRLAAIGLTVSVADERIGIASAIKMCRSVVIKGLEALAVESMFAARRYGAEEAVLKSLAATFPAMGWDANLPDYLISRVAEHGQRRAAEMRESAQAVADAGRKSYMAAAAAELQDALVKEIAEKLKDAPEGKKFGKDFSWRKLADALQEREKK